MTVLKKLSVLMVFSCTAFFYSMERKESDRVEENSIGSEKNIRKLLADLMATNKKQDKKDKNGYQNNKQDFKRDYERKAKL